MSMMSRLVSSWRNLTGKARVDRDLDDEVRSYVELLTAEKVHRGMSESEARRAALIETEGVEQVKEQVRDARAGALIESVLQDLRYALRQMRRSAGFTIVAVLTLALGIGANSTILGMIEAVWTRPLPVRDPDGLVRVFSLDSQGRMGYLSYADYADFRAQSRSFADLAVACRRGPTLRGNGWSEATLTNVVSDNYFTLLGVDAAAGRLFSAADARRSELVLVISYKLWQRRFGGRADIIGQAVNFSGRSFIVTAVAAKGFKGTDLDMDSDVWVPLTSWNVFNAGEQSDRRVRMFGAIGRLRPGVRVPHAAAEVEGIAGALEAAYPETNKGFRTRVLSERAYRFRNAGSTGVVLAGVGVLVLLIACLNIANLLVARGQARVREISIRLALGSSRTRLIRQLFTETVLLAALGTAAGLLLCRSFLRGLPLVLPSFGTHSGVEFILDSRVFAVTLLCSLLTTVLFGLFPAFEATRAELAPGLRSGPGSTERRRFPLRNTLVVVQVGLCVVQLVAGGLLLDSLVHAARADLGFRHSNVLVTELDKGRGPDGMEAYRRDVLERVRAMPGVVSAGIGIRFPLSGSGGGANDRVVIPGVVLPPEAPNLDVKFTVIDPGYLSTLRIRLVRGRNFTEGDDALSPRVVLINETMAGRFFGGQDPVGKAIFVGTKNRVAHEIVGIVDDVRINSVEELPGPYMYFPLAQRKTGTTNLLILTAGDPALLAGSVRQAMLSVDAGPPQPEIFTLSSIVWEQLSERRAYTTLIMILGGLGLLLAAIGLYGVVSYLVAQRTQELGIRMALGADRRRVLGMVIGRGLVLSAAGSVLGFAGAAGASRYIRTVLYGVSPFDPVAFLAVAMLIAALAIVASFVPARRAARIDPLAALRCE